MSEENLEKTMNVFDGVINDAKIPKMAIIEWEGKEIEIKYKVLVGEEDSEVEKKYGDDIVSILLEKTYLMIAKANNGSENDLTREQWNSLPGKFRTTVAMQVNLAKEEQAKLFRSLQQSQQASS